MRRTFLAGVVVVLCFVSTGFGALQSQVWYSTTELSAGRWEYNYEVSNIDLTSPIAEFTIWFGYGLYENLAVETASPTADNWDEIVLQPEDVLLDDGAYDAKTLGVGIEIGQTVGPFAVSFDWLGLGEPGPQFYEIIDPATLRTIVSGQTVPEPGMLLLLGLGTLALKRRS